MGKCSAVKGLLYKGELLYTVLLVILFPFKSKSQVTFSYARVLLLHIEYIMAHHTYTKASESLIFVLELHKARVHCHAAPTGASYKLAPWASVEAGPRTGVCVSTCVQCYVAEVLKSLHTPTLFLCTDEMH